MVYSSVTYSLNPDPGILLNPDLDTACCWIGTDPIRIQAKIYYDKIFNNICNWEPLQRTFRFFKHEIPSFFLYLGANFGLLGSGYRASFPIRIRWPSWIRIQSGSGSERLVNIPGVCVLRRPDKRPMVKDGSDYEWETWKRSARQIGLLGTAISPPFLSKDFFRITHDSSQWFITTQGWGGGVA